MTCFQQSDLKTNFRRWSGILNHCGSPPTSDYVIYEWSLTNQSYQPKDQSMKFFWELEGLENELFLDGHLFFFSIFRSDSFTGPPLRLSITIVFFCLPYMCHHNPLLIRTHSWIKFVYIFWEDHNILRNLHHKFVLCSASQIYSGDFAEFCGLLTIHELY